MTSHSESRWLPYEAKKMYDLVANVDEYPDFLPWCSAARVRSMENHDDHTIIYADLVISFRVFRESFSSRVVLNEQKLIIDTEYIDGPFRHLKSQWSFVSSGDGCEVNFYVDFEFRNAILRRIIGVVFNEAMQRIVKAFENRAAALYSNR